MMGVRQQINETKKLGLGVGAAVVVIALVLVAIQFRGPSDASAVTLNNAFYTDDNGKSFFKDDINKIVPFDHGGKQAYRADVFRGADGKQFVGLIYRYTDAGRKEMEAYIANKSKDPLTRKAIEQRTMQVKQIGRAHV